MIISEGKGPAQNNTDARAITQPNPSIDRTAEHHFAFGFLPDKVQHPTGSPVCSTRPQRPEKSIGEGEQHVCFTATRVDAWPTTQAEGPAVAGGAPGAL